MVTDLSQLAVRAGGEENGANLASLVIAMAQKIIWCDDFHTTEGSVLRH